MATWRPENSMLTQRGVEILNKLKAGVGSITVTRIVAGSGRVAESLLFQQTSISGVQKPMTISGKNTTDVGSEITFYIENKDFVEPYNLHQIGIYVTHPDYVGEQLYHISQCDANDYDTIPAISYTPVTQGYSVFMEHGNSSSVSITVDPSGMINTVQFNEFKESINSSIITINNSFNSLESEVVGLQNKTKYLSNQNLLVNWYLGNPVNQRGKTEYTYANAYTLDRWMVRGSSVVSYMKVSLEAGTVLTYENPAGDSNTVAFIQSVDDFKYLLGKTVTLSVLVEENSMSGGFQLGGWFAPNAFAQSANAMGRSQYFSGVGLFSFTAKINETTEYDYFNVGISVNPASNIGGRMKLIAAKLELGTTQTLAHQDENGNWVLNDPPPDNNMELLKCIQSTADASDVYANKSIYHELNVPPVNKVGRSVIVGSNSSTAITGWFPVGKIAINKTSLSKVVTLAVHGGAGSGSGILQIMLRVDNTSGVLSTKSYLRWIAATHEINESRFSIDASDKTNAILYVKLENQGYTAFTFSVLSEKYFANQSASDIIVLENNYANSPVEGTNYKTSITQSLVSTRISMPSVLNMYDGFHTRDVIRIYDDGDGESTDYGSELVIQAGGNIFLGSGESAFGVRKDLQENGARTNEPTYGKTNERLYLTSDGEIVLSTNTNNPANRKSVQITGAGAMIVPVNTDYGTSKVRNISAGTSDLTAGSSSLSNGNIYIVYE